MKCDATDEWARNRSATVGSSLEETCCYPQMAPGLCETKWALQSNFPKTARNQMNSVSVSYVAS